MTEHTKLPWRLRELMGGSYALYGEGEYDIVFPKRTGLDKDAAFIVKSCNNFDQLLEGCKWFIAQLDDRTLVRDISRDQDPDYHLRMLSFSKGLLAATNAIEAAEKE